MGCRLGNYESTIKSRMNDTAEELKFMVSSSNSLPNTVNDPIAILDNVTLNALGYALWCGRTNTFKYLKEFKGASACQMELLLEKQGTSGLEIAVSKGYLDLLKSYLPEYLLEAENKIDEVEALKKPLVFKAISKGFVEIVLFVYEYFKDVQPPIAFDLEFVDPETGDNSALVACKSFSLPMVRLLNETCRVDFGVVNKKGQNALQVVVNSANYDLQMKELVAYIIQNCRFDAEHQKEKVMKALDDQELETLFQIRLDSKAGEGDNERTCEGRKKTQELQELKQEAQASFPDFSTIYAYDTINNFSISVLQDKSF